MQRLAGWESVDDLRERDMVFLDGAYAVISESTIEERLDANDYQANLSAKATAGKIYEVTQGASLQGR